MSVIKSIDSPNCYRSGDTGNSNSKLVREIKEATNELSSVAKNISKNPINMKPQSPYYKDRREYDPSRLEGSDRENDWQDVKSRKQELDEALQDLNKIKLNIVF